MSRETRKPPLYQRYRDGGVLTHNIAGVEARLKPGDDAAGESVTWLVKVGTTGGLVPAVGDYLRDTAGRWWVAAEVGAESDGAYPVRCDRWQKDGERP